jgi:hypothetical protein
VNTRSIQNDLNLLPQEAQQAAFEFIEFLKTRYQKKTKIKPSARKPLKKERFVGMWRKRKDIISGSEWVRSLRRSEWSK